MIPLFRVGMHPAAGGHVDRVLQSGFIGQGPKVDDFEAGLKEILPFPAVAVNSCTSAIEMVLTHLGVGPGDEVITTALTCTATNSPIVHLGARPVWADVHTETGNVTPWSIAERVTRRTKAIIAVDWTGRRAEYGAIRELVPEIPIIQDAAHGPLFFSGDEHGDFICSSYGPIKHLTTGDGGSVAHRAPAVRAALRLLRWYGLDRTSSKDFRCAQNIDIPGMKWHMNDINATIGLQNLDRIHWVVGAHQENAQRLHYKLCGLHPLVLVPRFSGTSNYWVFPLLTDSDYRDSLREHLTARGIMSSQVHERNDRHTGFHYPSGELPGLDEYNVRHLNIPCGWWMTGDDVDTIVAAIREWAP